MWWRWPWRRPAEETRPYRAAHGSRFRDVWADLAYPDAVVARAVELAGLPAAEWAVLERVRGAAVVVACRRAGRWEVGHA